MSDSGGRNWLISVLFLDIVGYSKTSVDQQIKLKEVLNTSISDAIQGIPIEDRVILDTGDGNALCFLSDPEHALSAALSISRALATSNARGEVNTVVRAGINLGPVKLIRDLNNNLNAVGDGINVGQRIMSFAGNGEIMASRSFVEVVGCLKDSYANLFVLEGGKKDKHGREHICYRVVTSVQESAPLGTSSYSAPALSPHPAEAMPTGPQLAPSPAASLTLGDEYLSLVKSQISRHLGPIAATLVKKLAAKALSISDFEVRLLQEIPEGKERECLKGWLASPALQAARAKAPTPIACVSTEPSAAYCPTTVDAVVLGDAERTLASYIGPIAKLLVKKEAGRAKNAEELYKALASHIPEVERRESFLNQFFQ